MITTKDIAKLIAAFKEIFVTKEDLADFKNEMKTDFRTLQNSVDGFAKTIARHDDEIRILHHRVKNLEEK
jgi:hypothetical protein